MWQFVYVPLAWSFTQIPPDKSPYISQSFMLGFELSITTTPGRPSFLLSWILQSSKLGVELPPIMRPLFWLSWMWQFVYVPLAWSFTHNPTSVLPYISQSLKLGFDVSLAQTPAPSSSAGFFLLSWILQSTKLGVELPSIMRP